MKKNIYSALMQGLSYSLIFLVIRGLALSLNGYFNISLLTDMVKYSELLFAVFFVAFLCYDIADKPGLALGAIIGAFIYLYQTEIYGIIIYGILTGYIIKYVKKYLNYIPQELKYLTSLLWLPLITLGITIPIIYFSSPLLSDAYKITVTFLKGIENYHTSLFLTGGMLAAFMAYDAGGKINKTTYLVIVLLSKDFPIFMASVIIGGMMPPIIIASYRMIYRKKLILEEEPKTLLQLSMGLSFITEGALLYIKNHDRLRLTLIAGSFVAGALTALFKIGSSIPHGGILATVTMNNPHVFIIVVLGVALVFSQVIAINQYIIGKKEVK